MYKSYKKGSSTAALPVVFRHFCFHKKSHLLLIFFALTTITHTNTCSHAHTHLFNACACLDRRGAAAAAAAAEPGREPAESQQPREEDQIEAMHYLLIHKPLLFLTLCSPSSCSAHCFSFPFSPPPGSHPTSQSSVIACLTSSRLSFSSSSFWFSSSSSFAHSWPTASLGEV